MELFGKLRDMQEEMKKAKESLDQIIVEAEAGGGMVRVKANGNRKVLKITIDPDIIDKNDPEIMEDLVTAAVNLALDRADEAGREEIGKVSKGMMPNIPGFDPSKFGLE